MKKQTKAEIMSWFKLNFFELRENLVIDVKQAERFINSLPEIELIEFMGEGIEYWANLQNYYKEHGYEELIRDKITLEKTLKDLETDTAITKRVWGKFRKGFINKLKEILNKNTEKGENTAEYGEADHYLRHCDCESCETIRKGWEQEE